MAERLDMTDQLGQIDVPTQVDEHEDPSQDASGIYFAVDLRRRF